MTLPLMIALGACHGIAAGETPAARPDFSRAVPSLMSPGSAPLETWMRAVRETAADPAISSGEHATALNNLGEALRVAGRARQARICHDEALRLRESVFGADHPEVAISLANLSLLERERGRHTEAERLLRRAVGIQRRKGNEAGLAAALSNLGSLLLAVGRLEEAESHLRPAVDLLARLEPGGPEYATACNNLSAVYTALGRHAEAESILRRAAAFLERRERDYPVALAVVRFNMADLWMRAGRVHSAVHPLEQALRVFETHLGAGHEQTYAATVRLAQAWIAVGERSRGQAMLSAARRTRPPSRHQVDVLELRRR